MDDTSTEDYFFSVCHLEQFRTGFSIDNLYNFASAFGAFAGFAIYDNWFHSIVNFLQSYGGFLSISDSSNYLLALDGEKLNHIYQ